MRYVVYTLESSIATFFAESGTSGTREQCDEVARRLCGGEKVRPCPIQGSCSYTVIAGPADDDNGKIFQFREETSPLDPDTMALAREIHGDLVPRCVRRELVGGGEGGCSEKDADDGSPSSLSSSSIVYEMDRLPGENFITARPSLMGEDGKLKLQLNHVHSLAGFFAQSWKSGMPPPRSSAKPFGLSSAVSTAAGWATKRLFSSANPTSTSSSQTAPISRQRTEAHQLDLPSLRAQCESKLSTLHATLPDRLTRAVEEVNAPAVLTRLFADDGSYPLVLTHADLNETNILVDAETGRITGVVDWAGATLQPFGFAMGYALENVLGSMGPKGWTWCRHAERLREEFWIIFEKLAGLSEASATFPDGFSPYERRLVWLAARTGLLLRYGDRVDYLDALV